ncbi:ABC transporter permease subunit [Planobispora takensis]|uniref:Maltose/maltodextrin transport system permease protein n=1 Tax=Planobispora takensis TaxID=1367882 RepID=A0A8J3SX18_9ACTN|nr:ABC transporter permease subunit [Planobispora takensis]GII00333.1 sugar ABC transporter permease [Planobispora takensis]
MSTRQARTGKAVLPGPQDTGTPPDEPVARVRRARALPGREPRRGAPVRGWPGNAGAIAARFLTLGLIVAVALWAAAPLVSAQNWTGTAIVAAVTVAGLYVYLTPRRLPAKYLFPVTLLILALQVFPVVHTMSLALTNIGDGHLGTKQEAITAIETSSVRREPGSAEYRLTVAERDGEPVFLLAEGARAYVGTAAGLRPLEGATFGPGGRITAAEGYTVLTVAQASARGAEVTGLSVPVEGGAIRSQGLSRAYRGTAQLSYDAACDCVTGPDPAAASGSGSGDGDGDGEAVPQKVWQADEEQGRFVAVDGTALPQGWKVDVGPANLTAALTDPQVNAHFLGVLGWNVVYALSVVALTAALGIAVALVLHHPRMRAVRAYRTLIVLPYAMPAFAMLLVWRDMFNTDFGLVNRMSGLEVDWLGEPLTARLSVLLVQLWLGFPYMFLIATGALQTIPSEYLEAAQVDGATAWHRFRKVTFPLLMLALAPLLVSSFAFNFNNFNGVFLITAGGPFPADNPAVGATDLLITYTFRLAFGQQGAQYGLASAMSVYVYLIVAVISIISFRRTRVFKEVDR